MSEQFHIEEGYDTEREARFASRDLAIQLVEDLKAKGYTSFAPAPKPPNSDWAWDQFADCRILVVYLSPFELSEHADRFVCRVDVIAEKP